MAASLTCTLNSVDPEEMVVCPFDPVHRVTRKRLQYHIMKCSKNQDMRQFRTCPFNAVHVVLKWEFDYHVKNCPDRARLEAELLQQSTSESAFQLKGYTDLPTTDWRAPESNESWDDDNFTYVPPEREGLFSSENGTISTPDVAPDHEPPPVEVESPPQLRKPRPIGRGSQVFQYSLATAETRTGRRQMQPSVQPYVQPGVQPYVQPGVQPYVQPYVQPGVQLGIGRGRGLGRGRGVGVTPVVGDGGEMVVDSPLPLPPQPSQDQRNGELDEEKARKMERKLKKMLRQIEQLETKQLEGDNLNSEQLSKVDRKADVLSQLQKLSLL